MTGKLKSQITVILNHVLNLIQYLIQNLHKSKYYETLESKTLNLFQGKVQGDNLEFSQKILIILPIILLLAGCSLHKSNISEPLIEVPATFSNQEKELVPPLGKWWEQFGDEQLNSLMEEAFKYNLDIAQAYERLQQSLASVRITDSSRGLTVNIDGSVGRTRQSFGSISGQPDGFEAFTSDTYSLSAAASYELDLWKRLDSNTKAAQFDALALEQDIKALYISISAQLADLYYLAVEQRAQLELSDQTIASFQDTLERVERRYRGGLVPAIDVYQSRQNLASAKALRPLFESNLSETLNAISVLLGSFPNRKIGGTIKKFNDVPEFNVGLPSQLLTRRPDLKSALLRLKASDERIGAAIADRFPSFNLIGSYGGASDKIRNVLDSPNIFWNILLQVAQPILDAGRRRAEVDRAESVFRENLVLYHGKVLNAFKEVEDALARINASAERISMLKKSVSASESALRLAIDNYLQGLSDYLPVLTAQQRFYDSKSSLLAVKRQLISNRIQLVRALGGEWVDEVINEQLMTENIGEKYK